MELLEYVYTKSSGMSSYATLLLDRVIRGNWETYYIVEPRHFISYDCSGGNVSIVDKKHGASLLFRRYDIILSDEDDNELYITPELTGWEAVRRVAAELMEREQLPYCYPLLSTDEAFNKIIELVKIIGGKQNEN